MTKTRLQEGRQRIGGVEGWRTRATWRARELSGEPWRESKQDVGMDGWMDERGGGGGNESVRAGVDDDQGDGRCWIIYNETRASTLIF